MASSDDALQEQFKLFATFGDKRADGTTITLTQCDKWMKEANIIDGKKLSTNDTCIAFAKFKSKILKYPEFLKYIDQLATDKKLDAEVIKNKMARCGAPSTAGATRPSQAGVYERLTEAKNTLECTQKDLMNLERGKT